MTDRTRDLRDCATAYDCRDQLPELAAWMNDDALKQLTIWRGPRFQAGELYFDLDNPERGPFEATGDEQPPKVWAMLVTWRQPVNEAQGDSLAAQMEHTRPER